MPNIPIDPNMTRTNTKIISRAHEPVYTVSLNAGASASMNGRLYSVNINPATLKANGFIAVQISNPSSQRTAYINRILGSIIIPSDPSNINSDILREATLTGGTPLTPRNYNFAYPNDSVCTAKYVDNTSTDPTGGGAIVSSLRQPSATSQMLIDIDGQIIIPQGCTFTLRISNLGSQIGTLSLNITWWELDINN